MSDLDTGTKGWRPVWVGAAVIALMLHAGGAGYALTQFKADDDDGGLGAYGARVFDAELASPDKQDDDVPIGVDSVAQNASVATPEQQTQVEQVDVPKDVPNTTEEEADRVVTTSDIKKPTEEQKVAAVQTHASEAADAAEDSRVATLNDENVQKSDQVKGPHEGLGKDKEELTAKWGAKISGLIKLHQIYPKGGKKAAVVRVSMVLNRLGKVVSAAVEQSSGYTDYDAAAITMVHRSEPFPKPLAGLTDDEFPFSLEVSFNEGK